MPKIINAVFEDGVFKPLQKVDIQEHEKVALKVLNLDEWQMRFDQIIRKIHKKTAHYSPEEIESDIAGAPEEVRKEKRGN